MASTPAPSWSPNLAHRMRYLLVFLAAYLVYGATALFVGRTTTPRVAYFDYLADSFAHARVDLPDPPGRHDLCEFEGRVYVVFPPLPALLLTPWAWIAGRAAINTVAFSICLAALNIALAAAVIDGLRQLRWTAISRADALWLLAAFAFGTAHWYAAIEGSAWFLGHICTLTFVMAAIIAALWRHSLTLSLAFLAIAMLGRPHVILTAPLLLAIWRLRQLERTGTVNGNHQGGSALPFAIQILRTAWPLALAGMLLAAYNQIRFGNPLEFGYRYQNVETSLMGDLHGIGVFSVDYVMRNLKTMLISIPLWDSTHHRIVPSDEGTSLLLTAPALIWCLAARRPRDVVRAAWWSVALILIPLLTYYNAGWRQFGYRFSLDFLAPLLVLQALALGPNGRWVFRSLVVLGLIINAWGVQWWFEAARAFV